MSAPVPSPSGKHKITPPPVFSFSEVVKATPLKKSRPRVSSVTLVTPAKTKDADSDGFSLNNPKRQRPNTPTPPVETASTSTATASFPVAALRLFTVLLSKLPAASANQRALHAVIQKIPALKFSTLIVYGNRTARLQSTNPKLAEDARQIGEQLGQPITITEQNAKTPINSRPVNANASYSCVMKDVDLEIPVEEIKAHLADSKLEVRAAWRIRSRATNKDTRLIRIITNSHQTLDQLLKNGITMYSRQYRFEPSRPAAPQAIQCTRCMSYNHATPDCRERPICARCGSQDHHVRDCKKDAICINCNGPHPAYNYKCPRRPVISLSNPEKTAPLVCVDQPAAVSGPEDTPNSALVENVIRFTSSVLLNLLPMQRPLIQETINKFASQFLDRSVHISYHGNKIHISVSTG